MESYRPCMNPSALLKVRSWWLIQVYLVALVVKNHLPIIGDEGSIPESERPPGEGNGNAFQYSCLENPTDRGTWQATIHGITKNQTRLSNKTTTFMESQTCARNIWKSCKMCSTVTTIFHIWKLSTWVCYNMSQVKKLVTGKWQDSYTRNIWTNFIILRKAYLLWL